MTFIPTLLISLFLVASPCLAAPAPGGDDGLWHPASQAAVPTTTAAPVVVVSSPPSTQTYVAPGNWETAVTWPAGCESWANPCPAGAHVAGGGTAGAHASTEKPQGTGTTAPYENGFTSYTTMTDANGVITGMPPKATIAAGVSASTLVTAVKSSGNFSLTSTGARTGTQSGFSVATTASRPNASSGASQNAVGGAALFATLALIASLW